MLMKQTTKFAEGWGVSGCYVYFCKANEVLEVWAELTCWRERFSAVDPFCHWRGKER